MNRRLRKRRKSKSSGTPRWAVPCLILAIGLLIYGFSGGDAKVENLLRSVAGSNRFVTSALALELGIYPKKTAETHSPPPVSEAELSDSPSGEAYDTQTVSSTDQGSVEGLGDFDDAADIDPDIAEALVSESYFIPPNLKTANALPVSELTIKVSADGKGYDGTSGVYIKNDANLPIDVAAMLKKPMKIVLKGKGPQVMIVHTHGSESYTPTGKDFYMPDDVDRTQDKNFNVIRVGDEMTKVLTGMGIEVVHNREIFDYPSYNGSYTRSLAAISQQMKKTPSIKMIIDVHRDAMISKTGVKYKTVTEIGGKNAAQLMLVMGTNAGGQSHDNWQKNLNYTSNLQSRLNKKYPTLMRPIKLTKTRYNQHVTTGSMLLEVGTCGNTLEEAILAAKTFSVELGNTLLGK